MLYISQISKATSSASPASNWNQLSGTTEEADNVFTDDGNIEQTTDTVQTDISECVAVRDHFLASNPWKEDVKGIIWNSVIVLTIQRMLSVVLHGRCPAAPAAPLPGNF